MKQYSTPQTFSVRQFSPSQPMPVEWLNEEWLNNRVFAWDVLNDAQGGLNRFERLVAPLIPFVLLINLVLMTLCLQGAFFSQESSSFSAAFANPFTTISTVLVLISLFSAIRITRAAEKWRNTADTTVFKTVGSWINSRYGMNIDYTENLIDILSNEPVKNTTGFYLGTLTKHGEKVVVVRNIDGEEAPLMVN